MPHNYPLNDEPTLYQLQAPTTSPPSPMVDEGTDLLLTPESIQEALRHFPVEVYDRSPESNLVRFMQVLLGDAGAGQLRKRALVAHLQHSLAGSHFADFDRFYGALFGLARNPDEAIAINPYRQLGTAEEWREETNKDASFRSRIEGFATGINLSPTAQGMGVVAEALLSVDCEIHELWSEADRPVRTYGLIEDEFPTYGSLDGNTYGEIEENPHAEARSPLRTRFLVRPKRQVTEAERYNVRRVLQRLKPASTQVSVVPLGVPAFKELPLQGATSADEHWEIKRRISARAGSGDLYAQPVISDESVEQPRPAMAGYQGEAWTYNGEVAGIEAYTETEEGVWGEFTPAEGRVAFPNGSFIDYTARDALAPARWILAGRLVSDGVVASSPYVPSELAVRS